MSLLAQLGVAFVALSHIGFLVLEMFLWDTSKGRKIFAQTEQQSRDSKALAANQGLYNGFLAAGLIWGLVAVKVDVIVFFLACVIIAGVFGAMTAKRSILFIQALPAAVAMALVLYG